MPVLALVMEKQLKVLEYRSDVDFVDMLWIRGSRTEERTANRQTLYRLLDEHKAGKSVGLTETDKEVLDWILDHGGKEWIEKQCNDLFTL